MKNIPDIVHDFDVNRTKYVKTTIYSPATNNTSNNSGGFPWSDYEGEEGYVSYTIGKKEEKETKEVKKDDKPLMFRPQFEEFDAVRAYYAPLAQQVSAVVLKVNELGGRQYSYDLQTYDFMGPEYPNNKEPVKFTTTYVFPCLD